MDVTDRLTGTTFFSSSHPSKHLEFHNTDTSTGLYAVKFKLNANEACTFALSTDPCVRTVWTLFSKRNMTSRVLTGCFLWSLQDSATAPTWWTTRATPGTTTASTARGAAWLWPTSASSSAGITSTAPTVPRSCELWAAPSAVQNITVLTSGITPEVTV